MKAIHQPNTKQILKVMQALAWIPLITYSVKAGSILISFIVSLSNPIASKDLYLGLDYSGILDFEFNHYLATITLELSILGMLIYVWLLILQTLMKLDLDNPFTMEVALKLEKIAISLFRTWVLMMVASGYMAWLHKLTGGQYSDWSTSEFIFMSGLIYVFSQIFKRGVEIQSENELTV